MKKLITKKFDVAAYMPPLPHTVPGKVFDIHKSPALNWLLSQEDILNYVWTKAIGLGKIVYNKNTGCWCGVENPEVDI